MQNICLFYFLPPRLLLLLFCFFFCQTDLLQSIEFFLAKKVTHFVTDKPIDRDGNLLSVSNHYLSPSSLLLSAQTKTPSPAQTKPASIQSLHDLNTSDDKQAAATAGSRPKSRADAMVQRARTTTQPLDSKSVQCASSQSILQNPMQLALNWGTPIWNTDYTLKFLEKVLSLIHI